MRKNWFSKKKHYFCLRPPPPPPEILFNTNFVFNVGNSIKRENLKNKQS